MFIFRNIAAALFFCFLFFHAPHGQAASPIVGKVVSVADGDTITVLTRDKLEMRVRLYGIDCPERKQAFGNRARQATGKAVAGKVVTVREIDRDRYGRTVAVVDMQEGGSLNALLVRGGMAWVYTRYCTQKDICGQLRNMERTARAEKRGLWADDDPVPPWEWRKTRKKP